MRNLRFPSPVLLALLLALSVCTELGWAQDVSPAQGGEEGAPKPRAAQLHIVKFPTPVRVDGILDEAVWETASVVPLNYEWFPNENVEPKVKTTCYMGYDSSNLYLGCDAEDPKPEAIRAHYMDRDSVALHSGDDSITVLIDAFNDQRRAFEFRVNPLGAQVDGIWNEIRGGSEDFSWDAIWRSAGRITSTGYIVEMAIPLQQIRFPSSPALQTWGISLGRNYPREFRYRITSYPRDRNTSCLLCQIHKVSGFQDLQAGRNVEVVPTLTLSRTDQRPSFPNGSFVNGDEKTRTGVDLRWGITPSLQLNATANPDFSQVEADVAQLAVNERFALQFPEKRPFFLEGQDFFDTPMRAVFTRTVVDPDWGAKLTGKLGSNALGVFTAHDGVNSLVFPRNDGSSSTLLDDEITSSVLRYRRDLGSGSTLGALVTNREGTDYHNRVAGADAFIRLASADDLRVQFLRSDTQYPDAVARQFRQSLDAFTGDAIYARYQHSSRRLYSFVEYKDLDPEFRTDSGFVTQVDVRSAAAYGAWQIWGDKDNWWNQLLFGGYHRQEEDGRGDKTFEQQSVVFRILSRGQNNWVTSPQVVDQVFRGRRYDNMYRVFFDWKFQPSGSFRGEAEGTIGENIDFTNNQPGHQTELTPSMDVKIGRRTSILVRETYRRFTVPKGELFEASLTDLRIFYHFNVRMFARAVFQYQNVTRDPSLYLVPISRKSENLVSQFLFSYKVNPRTVLFVGYSDNQTGGYLENTNINPTDLTRTDRTFFIKVGHGLVW